jgi:uncharacterized protein (DUF952 family)
MLTPETAYKILTAEQFAALQAGTFAGSPADIANGFIHLSTAEQLTGTAQKHYAGQTGLVVLAVALGRITAPVRWEVSRGGELFPHIYGPLRMADIFTYAPLRWADGKVALPA